MVLVTSRVKPYEQGRRRLDELPAATLLPLNEPRVERFLLRWHGEAERSGQRTSAQAQAARKRLAAALAVRTDLREMAGTPLLLTMLARVNLRGRLPEGRAELYEECVAQLLWEWEKLKQSEIDFDAEPGAGGALESLDTLLQIDDERRLQRVQVERVLWEMTYDAHGRSSRQDAELPASELEARLAKVHPQEHQGKAWASRVTALMRERGGLLVENDVGSFGFPHRSFQEYLAARWLLTYKDRAETAASLATSDIWREVVLLACGRLRKEGDTELLQTMIQELAADPIEENGDRRRLLTAGQAWLELGPENGDRRRLLTAGQAWLELGPENGVGSVGRGLKADVPRRLTGVMQDSSAPASLRLDAGLIAADLDALPGDLDIFVDLPPMGEVGYALRMAKYPVTNAQYRVFVDEGGYDDQS